MQLQVNEVQGVEACMELHSDGSMPLANTT